MSRFWLGRECFVGEHVFASKTQATETVQLGRKDLPRSRDEAIQRFDFAMCSPTLNTFTLFRPIGPSELRRLEESDFACWPARLPEQPIFYPVTNETYAREIASRWNVEQSGAGYVTRFEVREDFMRRYAIHRVGAAHHTEWWIPAGDLDELNAHLVGRIELIASFAAR